MQREIADSAYRYQTEIDAGERIIVGVNDFVSDEDDLPPPIHRIDPESERRHLERLARVRRERDNVAVGEQLAALGQAARRERDNLMPYLMDGRPRLRHARRDDRRAARSLGSLHRAARGLTREQLLIRDIPWALSGVLELDVFVRT